MILFVFGPDGFCLSLWGCSGGPIVSPTNSDVFCGQKIQGEKLVFPYIRIHCLWVSRILINPKMQERNGGWYFCLLSMQEGARPRRESEQTSFPSSLIIFFGCESPFRGSSSLISVTSLWWSASDRDIIIAYLVISWFSSLIAIRIA